MPHPKTRAVWLMLLFTVTVLPAFSQDARPAECPPGSDPFKCEVRRAADRYFTLLKAKDWNALSQLGLRTRHFYEMPYPGANLSLRLLEQLLDPLKIEAMTYTAIEVSGGPNEAEVRYWMRLRATDPRSGKTVINVTGAQRVLEWTRIVCNCPETGMRAWRFKRDAFSADGVTKDYVRARTVEERKFVLIGLEKSALEGAAGVLQRQGIELINSGDYGEAFKIFSQAQEMHKEIKNQGLLSSRLDVEDSEQQIKSALAISNKPALASVLTSAARSYAELKENERARSYLETSLRLYTEVGDMVAAANVHKELGELRLEEGDYLGGVMELQRSIDNYSAVGATGKSLDEAATSNLVDAASLLFLIYELRGREADAAKIMQDVKSVLPDEYKALLMFGRGLFQWLRGEAPPNFDELEKAFELLDKLPRTESGEVEGGLTGMSLVISLAHSMQGDYTKAARNLQRAREVILKWKMTDPELAEWGDMPRMFVTLMEALFYGTGSSEEGLVSRFKKIMPRISDVSEISGPKLPMGEMDVPQMLDLLSMEYLAGDRQELALQCLLQAEAFAGSSDDKTLPIRIHQHLAMYYKGRNNSAKVIEHLNTGIRLGEELHGSMYEMAFGRFMGVVNLALLASTYEEMEKYSEARRNYQKLSELLEPFTLFNYVLHKSIAETYYAEGKYAESVKELEKGIALAKKVGMRYSLWEMYQLSGWAHWANGERPLARLDLEASVAEIEAMRRTVIGGEIVLQRFFEDKVSPYYDLIEILLQQGDCAGAFGYAERIKSRVLLDALKRGRKSTRNMMSPGERGEESTLRRNLIMLNRQVAVETNRESAPGRLDSVRGARAEARLDYELFRANLNVAHPQLATTPMQETLNTEGLRDLLHSPDTALLEYVVTAYSSYLFVVATNAEPRSGRVGSGAPTSSLRCWYYPLKIAGAKLEDKVNDFRARVGHPEGLLQEQARELYELLLRPAQQQLAGKKTLIIVPDGILWDMPFQALKPTPDHYLLQDSGIYYAPSFTTLREMTLARQTHVASPPGKPSRSGDNSAGSNARGELTLLAIGNPLFSDGAEPLRGTGELANRIESLYGKTHANVYTGVAADEERIKSEASGYQVIHIGTHGVLDNDNPMYSYVALFRGAETGDGPVSSSPAEVALDLTEDTSKDGFLEAWEIMELELNAQLVVLSGCETARGQVGNGEGMVGLSWALFIAGSPTTVVSQWKVDEKGTNELMYSFHENLVLHARSTRSPGGAAAALRKASLKLMESTEYKHPYYWAGFVVIGDGSE